MSYEFPLVEGESNWCGQVNMNNIDEVAAAIEAILTGRRFTFVSTRAADVAGYIPQIRVKTSMELDCNTEDGKGVFVSKHSDTYGSIYIHDDDGSYIIGTSVKGQPTFVSFDYLTISVDQTTGSGDRIRWIFKCERANKEVD